ncbi:MAG TPA: hypothetical protein VF636_02585 [Sphingomonas sp.]|jgi:hypothetical protein
MLLALLLVAQEPQPERFSILLDQPCDADARAKAAARGEVLVCADGESERLPLPDERVPTGPVASNPYLRGTEAMALEATPCAARQEGCQVGFGQPIVAAALKGLIDLAKDATAKKPDKRGRVPIDISEP